MASPDTIWFQRNFIERQGSSNLQRLLKLTHHFGFQLYLMSSQSKVAWTSLKFIMSHLRIKIVSLKRWCIWFEEKLRRYRKKLVHTDRWKWQHTFVCFPLHRPQVHAVCHHNDDVNNKLIDNFPFNWNCWRKILFHTPAKNRWPGSVICSRPARVNGQFPFLRRSASTSSFEVWFDWLSTVVPTSNTRWRHGTDSKASDQLHCFVDSFLPQFSSYNAKRT